MQFLSAYCPDPLQETRILNALWRELNPTAGKRPPRWQPSPNDVSTLELGIIQGLGRKSTAIILRWLAMSRDS